ncbi:unnamed protein product [Cylicostephanus goldi]|uniref:Uncharacterized protein n=1 Tax=Cylicostephanus goldi TaxID=71465 RepID=A0A3P6RV14_CYLGO|nr:unnamed protein product [Cylicostephanus goldi]
MSPHTREKEGKNVDNRVGPLHPTEHDPSTEEDYKNILNELIRYLNLSGGDNSVDQSLGFAHTQKRIGHGRFDNYGYYIGEGGDPDYDGDNDPDSDYDFDDSDSDFDFDDEFGYHDELK